MLHPQMDPKFLRNQKYAKKNNAVRRRALFPRRVSVRACSARFANAQKHVGQKRLVVAPCACAVAGTGEWTRTALTRACARRWFAVREVVTHWHSPEARAGALLETVQLASASALECFTVSDCGLCGTAPAIRVDGIRAFQAGALWLGFLLCCALYSFFFDAAVSGGQEPSEEQGKGHAPLWLNAKTCRSTGRFKDTCNLSTGGLWGCDICAHHWL